jgi:hypothetical protein
LDDVEPRALGVADEEVPLAEDLSHRLGLDQLTPGSGRPYDVDAITTRLVRRLVRED